MVDEQDPLDFSQRFLRAQSAQDSTGQPRAPLKAMRGAPSTGASPAPAPAPPAPPEEELSTFDRALQVWQTRTITGQALKFVDDYVFGDKETGVEGVDRAANVVQGVGRGAVKAVDETIETATGLIGWGANKAGFTERTGREIGEQWSIHDEVIDGVLGRKSDDKLAGFVEGVTQFAVGFVGLGKIAWLGKAKNLAQLGKAGGVTGFAANAVRGAMADFTVFDPYEDGLAEFFAEDSKYTSWIPGAAGLGKLMSVEDDDSVVEARLKRVGEGFLAGTTIDVVRGLFRIGRGIAKLRRTGDPAVADDTARLISEHEERVRAIASAEYTPEGAHLVVRQTEDGGFTAEFADGTPVKLPDPPAAAAPAAGEGAARGADDVVDDVEARPADTLEDAADQVQAPDELRWADRAEAETQVAIFNGAINARLAARREITSEEMSSLVTAFSDNMLRTPDELFEAMDSTGHFNVSHIVEPRRVLSMMEAVTTEIADTIEKSRVTGKFTEEQMIGMVKSSFGRLNPLTAPDVVIAKLQGLKDAGGVANHVWTLVAEGVRRHQYRRLAELGTMIGQRPQDMVLAQEFRIAMRQQMQLDRLYAMDNSAWGLSGKAKSIRGHQEMGKLKYGEADPELAEKLAKSGGMLDPTTGMTHRDIRKMAEIYRMGRGQVIDPSLIADAAVRLRDPRKRAYVLEWFTNSLLSSVPTQLTPLVSGMATGMMEAGSRTLGGLVTGNRPLAREGLDIAWGNASYFRDNLASYWKAMKAGGSIINPHDAVYSMEGLKGSVVRLPSRGLMAMDEFVRVSNYRAFVRARALRLARADGVTGKAARARADEAVKQAFDDETGIALYKEALDFAEIPTFSGELGRDTFSGGFHEWTNNHIEAKFIAPFVKASVNLFRYAWAATPGLNRFNKQAKAIMEAGGEEATILHARSAIAASLYGTAFYAAWNGDITGRGPSDHALRAMEHKQGFQPYSIKIGDEWISYRRMDPLGYPLGMAADLVTMIREVGTEDASVEEMAYAVVASLVSNLSSKTYMQGISQFAEAWTKGDAHTLGRWMQNFGGNMVVPNLVNTMNPDDSFREVRGMMDAVISRTPGLSDTLMPRFDGFGEVSTKVSTGVAPGSFWGRVVDTLNRGANPLRASEVKEHRVAEELLALKTALPPRAVEQFGLDLSNPAWDTESVGMRPYERWMELVRTPKDGGPSLTQSLDELVRSEEWAAASGGTSDFLGGERKDLALMVRDQAYGSAWADLLEEYPALERALEAKRELEAAASYEGAAGQSRVKREYADMAKFLGW